MKVSTISKNDYNATFGVRYTKESAKVLKELLPTIIKKDKPNLTQTALERLIQAKKRDDNLLVNIFEDPLENKIFDFEVGHLSNKLKIFKKPILSSPDFETEYINSDYLLSYAEYINSDDFVKESNRVLLQEYRRRAKLPFLKKLKEDFIRITKINELYMELLEVYEDAKVLNGYVIIHEDGSSKHIQGLAVVREYLLDKIFPNRYKKTLKKKLPLEEQYERINGKSKEETLTDLIDKLVE